MRLNTNNGKFNRFMFLSLVSLFVAMLLDFKFNNDLDIWFYLLPTLFYFLDEFVYGRNKRRLSE